MHSSKNVEVEVTREQLSDKRAGIHKGVFIKGREEMVEDVIVFIANTVCFDRFGIQMTEGDENAYSFVLQFFIQMLDVLLSATYSDFNEKFKTGGHEYMAQTLITYVFNILSLFLPHAKLLNAVQRVKNIGTMDPRCFRMPMMIHK